MRGDVLLCLGCVAAAAACDSSATFIDGGVPEDSAGVDTMDGASADAPEEPTADAADGATAGAEDAGVGCEVAVATGQYAITVVGLENGPSLGLGFEWMGGPLFAGHIDDSPPNRCDGTLSPAEADRITTALNAAHLFCEPSRGSAGAADCAQYDVTVRTLDGARVHRFCYSNCAAGMPLSGFVQALRDPVWRLWGEGACDGLPYDIIRATDMCPRP